VRALLVTLLLTSTAAAQCPDKAPTRNCGEIPCQSSRRVWSTEMTYYYGILSDCTPITIAIVTVEADCEGRVTRTCSGVAC